MKHYFIDGYNLLFRLGLKKGSLQNERDRLIRHFADEIAPLPMNITLVFDGCHEGDPFARGHVGDVEVIYTEKKQTADDYILEELAYAKQAVVVSSDRGLVKRAQLLEANTQSVEDFLIFVEKKLSKKTSHSTGEFKESKHHMERLLKVFVERYLKDQGDN